LSGEGYCSAYYRTYGLETVALRFGNVYGPGSDQKNSVIAKFIKQAIEGETLQIYGDGEQTRDFIFIDDLINAIRLAASVDDIGGEIFQIGTNAERTVTEIVERLLPLLTQAGITDIRVRHVAPRQGDVRRNFSDTSKARKLLGWQAQIELETGLERTWKWFSGLHAKKIT
jgi:UDP-glucose 4-epimerase